MWILNCILNHFHLLLGRWFVDVIWVIHTYNIIIHSSYLFRPSLSVWFLRTSNLFVNLISLLKGLWFDSMIIKIIIVIRYYSIFIIPIINRYIILQIFIIKLWDIFSCSNFSCNSNLLLMIIFLNFVDISIQINIYIIKIVSSLCVTFLFRLMNLRIWIHFILLNLLSLICISFFASWTCSHIILIGLALMILW